jgi:hypothetical protein
LVRTSLGVLVLLWGCAGPAGTGAKHQPLAVAPVTPRQPAGPPRLEVEAHREDSLLAVRVTVQADGVLEGESYEDAQTWHIVATDADGNALQPVVAAPCKVVRVPVPCATRACNEAPRWDIEVTATRYFAWPGGSGPVAVHVDVPGAGSQQAEVATR